MKKKTILSSYTPISCCKQIKYLGIINFGINCKPYIKELLNIKSITSALYPLIGKRSLLNFENKFLLYNAITKPITSYAAVS
jgi:hypothetical protein